jgi:tryptophanase
MGFLAVGNRSFTTICNELIMREFVTYGGFRRDLMHLPWFVEGMDEAYLAYRLGQTAYLWRAYMRGVPTIDRQADTQCM